MTPQELHLRCPRLYHVTELGGAEGICRHGLLSAERICDRFEVDPDLRRLLLERPRPNHVPLQNEEFGRATLNNNRPLLGNKLKDKLEDGLDEAAWLAMLNSRVFFFPNCKPLGSLLKALKEAGRKSEVLVFDTLELARCYADTIEIAAFNTGSAIYPNAPKRGRSTFAKLKDVDFDIWRKCRGQKDDIKEVTIPGAVPNAREFIVASYAVG